jgi:predicted regulator of Ras-like GTPase activity (Roadblock/LC7/MglB family)
MFSEILEGIVEGTSGGVGAVLMGYDGIAVEYANVLKEIKKTAEILNTGIMQEVSIQTERFQVVIRTLTDEYFVALTLERTGNFGKGRYLLMREAANLKEALA